ncbi:MAG: DNA repair protein RecO [Oligoflexia bacterium]|nr:DNA repair protein RecO [Oligoflexia bacterium]
MHEGIVIRTFPSGESDLVLRILSSQEGKLSAIAKYARSSKRRFSTNLDLFDHGAFEIKRGRGSLAILQSFSPLPAWRGLREDLDKFALANLICESFDLLIKEGNPDGAEFYEILALGLAALNESSDLKGALRASHLALASLLKVSGFHSDAETAQPSMKSFLRLMDWIERSAETPMKCRAVVEELLQRLT